MPSTGEEVRSAEGLLGAELAGFDALEVVRPNRSSLGRRAWAATWPKVAAAALALGLWQAVVWSGWRPEYVLPPPGPVFGDLVDMLRDGSMLEALATTMRRAAVGFALAVVLGTVVGSLVAQSRILRSAVGSLVTGLQTMPSIAWFPLAMLLFQISEEAILFVVVLGAAPAVANGLVAGADQVPQLLLRAGRVLGAGRLALYRHVLLPAAFPSYLSGLKQGWAFAWRSLMAGELIVIIANRPSIGTELNFARQFSNATGLLAMMIVILVIGIVVDSLLFGTLERWTRRRWGFEDGRG